MWTSRRWVPPAAGLVVVIAMAGCADATSSGAQSAGPVVEIPEARRGTAVDLSGKTLEGNLLDIATMRGSIVVINVWGSWCAPCAKEAPELNLAYATLHPKGVQFVGIDTRDNSAAALAFVARFGTPYPSLVDDGSMLLAFRGSVPAAAIPTTIILDRKGRIAGRVLGATDATTVEGLVEDADSADAISAS